MTINSLKAKKALFLTLKKAPHKERPFASIIWSSLVPVVCCCWLMPQSTTSQLLEVPCLRRWRATKTDTTPHTEHTRDLPPWALGSILYGRRPLNCRARHNVLLTEHCCTIGKWGHDANNKQQNNNQNVISAIIVSLHHHFQHRQQRLSSSLLAYRAAGAP